MDFGVEVTAELIRGQQAAAWLVASNGAVLAHSHAARADDPVENMKDWPERLALEDRAAWQTACTSLREGVQDQVVLRLAVAPNSLRRSLAITLAPNAAGRMGREPTFVVRDISTSREKYPEERRSIDPRLLQQAARHAGFAQWVYTPEDDRLRATETYFELLGFAPHEVAISSDWVRDRLHPEDRDWMIALMMQLRGGEIASIETDYRLRCKDGEYKCFQLAARRHPRPGLPDAVCGSLIDITARKENEERMNAALQAAETARQAAEKSDRLLHIAADHAGVAPWFVDVATGAFSRSQNFGTITGFTGAEVSKFVGGMLEQFHPDDLPKVQRALGNLMQNATAMAKVHARLMHKEGHWVWCELIGVPFGTLEDGRAELICGLTYDITERRANEARLANAAREAHVARAEAQEAAEILLHSTENSNVAPWYYYPDSATGRLADHLGKMLGYDHNRPLGLEDLRALIHPDDLPAVAHDFTALQAGKIHDYKHSFRLRRADGQWCWFTSMGRDVERAEEGLPRLLCGALTEIDQLKTNETRLEEAALALGAANARFVTMAENAPGAIFECKLNTDGAMQFVFFSSSLPDMVGVRPRMLAADGRAMFTHVPLEDLQTFEDATRNAVKNQTPLEQRLRINHPREGERTVLAYANPSALADGSVDWYGNLIDVTEQIEAERHAQEAAEKLWQAHQRLNTLTNISTVAIFEYRMFADGRSDFPHTTARFHELTGYSRAEIEALKDGIFARVEPEDLPGVHAALSQSAQTGQPLRERFRINHPERGVIWVETSANAPRVDQGVFVWSAAMFDVSADVARENDLRAAHRLAEEMRAKNEHQALHDGLTDLPNRRYYDQTLTQRMAQAQEQRAEDCALIRLDLDHFKYVNDTLGHEAGDLVLMRVAEVLRESLRPGDFAARIGGDEFSILLAPGTDEPTACALVESIRTRLTEPLSYEGRQCRFGASFGIAHTEDLLSMGTDIQMFADAALYRAKTSGRNRLELFTPQLHNAILSDRSLAVEIHDGLDKDQFEPYFQPQVLAATGALVGAETLLRWNHPTAGILSPDSFMHVAEQLRLVPEIDRIMMEKARDALARWRADGIDVPKISFNVSSGRMHDPDVVARAREMVQGQTRVTFELLESILIEEENDAFRFHLDAIREAGVDIEIDDFGSGHASIIGLMEIAPSALKIDKRIVMPVAEDMRARNLVSAIVEIAETLGIETIAEGVETEEQAAILRAAGCDVLQGYLFARPLSEAAFASHVQKIMRRSA